MAENSNTIDKGVGLIRGFVCGLIDIAKGEKVVSIRDLTPEERRHKEAEAVAAELARREGSLRKKPIGQMTDEELREYQSMLHKELNNRRH